MNIKRAGQKRCAKVAAQRHIMRALSATQIPEASPSSKQDLDVHCCTSASIVCFVHFGTLGAFLQLVVTANRAGPSGCSGHRQKLLVHSRAKGRFLRHGFAHTKEHLQEMLVQISRISREVITFNLLRHKKDLHHAWSTETAGEATASRHPSLDQPEKHRTLHLLATN